MLAFATCGNEAQGQTGIATPRPTNRGQVESKIDRPAVRFRETAPAYAEPQVRSVESAARILGPGETPFTPPVRSPSQQFASGIDNFLPIQETARPTETLTPGGALTLRNSDSPLLIPANAVNTGLAADHQDFSLDFRITPPILNGTLPTFRQGMAPENADIKAGPVYLTLGYASATVLATDNANLTTHNREAGAIAISELGFQMLVQVTESLQFAASGAFVYYPTKNKAGVVAYGANDRGYGFEGELLALPLAALQWKTEVGGWPITVIDKFTHSYGDFTFNTGGEYGFFVGNQFNAEDTIGRYSFRTAQSGNNTELRATDPQLREANADSSFYENTLIVATDRFLPGDVRLRVRAFQENLWYNQDRRGLPELRQGILASLTDEREDLRFKPFISYLALRDSYTEGFDQSVFAGLFGPIDDQVRIFGEVGYLFNQDRNLQKYLWTFQIHHDAGPFTYEDFTMGRSLTYFDDSLDTFALYQLHQVFGPRLTGTLFGRYSDYEDLLHQYGEEYIWSVGLQLDCQLGPRTRVRAQVIYNHGHGAEDADTWIGRLILDYRFSDTFTGDLVYQYQNHDVNRPSLFGSTYFEDLLVVRLTKSFH